MAVIDRHSETALDSVRDRYGRTVDHHGAATARAGRNIAALETYAAYLAQHADQLLDAAHSTLDKLPAARHTSAWRDLLAALGASHVEILRALDRPAPRGPAAEREQHAALWPHLAAWADYGSIAADLADQNHQPTPELTSEEGQTWTQLAQAAQLHGELELIESWFGADGRRITLADLIEDDTSTVVALAGDPDAPGLEVIGHYADVYAAGQALPRPVSPGVLRPEAASRFNRPDPAPERPLLELLQDVHEGQSAGDASEALLGATQQGFEAGPMLRLQHLLVAPAEFSHALETVQGRQIGARLEGLGRQLAFLTREVQEAAEGLGATVAVLPPHRAPQPPRLRPRPALDTTPPAPPHGAPAPARRQ